jgi:hypothetical protein
MLNKVSIVIMALRTKNQKRCFEVSKNRKMDFYALLGEQVVIIRVVCRSMGRIFDFLR